MDEHIATVDNDQDLLQLNENTAFLTVQSWLDFDKAMDTADPIYTTNKKTVINRCVQEGAHCLSVYGNVTIKW